MTCSLKRNRNCMDMLARILAWSGRGSRCPPTDASSAWALVAHLICLPRSACTNACVRHHSSSPLRASPAAVTGPINAEHGQQRAQHGGGPGARFASQQAGAQEDHERHPSQALADVGRQLLPRAIRPGVQEPLAGAIRSPAPEHGQLSKRHDQLNRTSEDISLLRCRTGSTLSMRQND